MVTISKSSSDLLVSGFVGTISDTILLGGLVCVLTSISFFDSGSDSIFTSSGLESVLFSCSGFSLFCDCGGASTLGLGSIASADGSDPTFLTFAFDSTLS